MSFGGQGGMGPRDEMEALATQRMMLGMIKTCFNDCVNDFRQETLAAAEKTCLQNCTMRNAKTFEVMAQAQGTLQSKMGGGAF